VSRTFRTKVSGHFGPGFEMSGHFRPTEKVDLKSLVRIVLDPKCPVTIIRPSYGHNVINIPAIPNIPIEYRSNSLHCLYHIKSRNFSQFWPMKTNLRTANNT